MRHCVQGVLLSGLADVVELDWCTPLSLPQRVEDTSNLLNVGIRGLRWHPGDESEDHFMRVRADEQWTLRVAGQSMFEGGELSVLPFSDRPIERESRSRSRLRTRYVPA